MTGNQINYWNLKETQRSNAAKEAETNRANVAKETELHRSNVKSEDLTRRGQDIGMINTGVSSLAKVISALF